MADEKRTPKHKLRTSDEDDEEEDEEPQVSGGSGGDPDQHRDQRDGYDHKATEEEKRSDGKEENPRYGQA